MGKKGSLGSAIARRRARCATKTSMKRDAIILIAGRGLQAILTIALFRVITTMLAPAQVGGVYLIFSVAYLFTSFLINPVSFYINRKLFAWHDAKTISAHLAGYNYYVAAVSILAFPLVWCCWRYFGVGAGLSGLVFSAEVACYIYVLIWNLTLLPILNTLGHRLAFVLLSVAASALGLALSAGCARYGLPTAQYWLAGQIAALGLVTAVGVFVFAKKVPEPRAPGGLGAYFKKETLRAIWLFTLPLAVSSFFLWAQGQSYRVIVEKVSGAEFLGYLAVGFSIATSVAGILESLVQQLYLPGFYRKITGGGKAARGAALSELAAQTVPVYIIYLFFMLGAAELLLYFLAAEKYHAVFVYARYGAFIEFCRMTSNVLAAGAYAEMRTKALIKPYFWGGAAAAGGVYLAALSPQPSLFIPLALAASGLITVFGLVWAIKAMTPLSYDYRPALKALLSAALFLPLALFSPGGFWPALGVLLAAGVYFAYLQYRAARHWLGAAGLPSQGVTPPEAGENLSQA